LPQGILAEDIHLPGAADRAGMDWAGMGQP
jgi:hypothetical protein